MSADLYDERMMRLARSADAGAHLDDAEVSLTLDNPMCGDRVSVELRRDAAGRVAALGQQVRGCVLCRAAAAVLAEHAPGCDAAALGGIRDALRARLRSEGYLPDDPAWKDLAVFEPVAAHKSRHECVLLPFDAVLEALQRG